jgi:phosphoribosyl-ATP pyrophosphohydrolase/phosphoribosyl-AMP cyclohydrolase/histidinol dehydrogenase
MGGSKPTFVPFPTFNTNHPANGQTALTTVGRCRINPLSCTPTQDEFLAIFKKNLEQSKVDESIDDPEVKADNKKLKKKFMKQGVAMAERYLFDTLQVDASIINVEILIDASMILSTDGCIAACFLDAGCDRIAVKGETLDELLQAMDVARVPKERIVAHFDDGILDMDVMKAISDYADAVSLVVAKDEANQESCMELIKKISAANNTMTITIQIPASVVDNNDTLVSCLSAYFGEKDTPKGTVSLIDPSAQQLGNSYASCIRTDRSDGLFTTVVCSRSGEALGLVYSSKESIIAALECGRGVYYSRSRNNLWRKGDTSGHYQTLHRIDVDCDGDALRFTVTQRGEDCAAFCHLNTLTCWGEPHGLRHLEGTLKDRLKNSPAGSYTKRLFDDPVLLRDKLVEEAQELSEADTRQHVAEELADVLYFAMVKAAKAGVSMDDAVRELDRRTRKVTRRQGDSKAFRIKAGNEILKK